MPITNTKVISKSIPKSVPKPRLTVQLQTLADLGVQRSYRKGAVILNEGDTGDAIYILIQGRLRVFGSAASGKEITYGMIEAGDYFGEMSLDGGTRSASIEATEPCLCSVVTNAHVLAYIRDNSEFGVEILHKAIGRARAATASARDMALLDVYERLAQILSRLANMGNEDTPPKTIDTLITHAEIASNIGASREMVSKLMKDLERGGYIQVENRQITLLRRLPARW
jgi:CRP/FNR family cyclic AMP-dependent transcriptional regulator